MEKQVIEHANLFLSLPMTLNELSKRTTIKEDDLLKEFNYDLYLIDKALALRVEKVLEYLEKNKQMAS